MFNPRRITTPINLLHREEAVVIGTLTPGARGFDCNAVVTPDIAAKFVNHRFADRPTGPGYQFVMRYVRRATRHDYDLTSRELVGLLQTGLGVGVVQHVAAEGWLPTPAIGESYGAIAAEECRVIGIPPSTTVWCDLEGVHPGVPHQQVIDYCNGWYSKVKEAGYQPGLYVGYGAGLSGSELYYKLRFQRYWSAYNLNGDQYPVKRGVQMRQGAYPPPAERVAGVPFQYDSDLITPDAMGDSPTFVLPK